MGVKFCDKAGLLISTESSGLMRTGISPSARSPSFIGTSMSMALPVVFRRLETAFAYWTSSAITADPHSPRPNRKPKQANEATTCPTFSHSLVQHLAPSASLHCMDDAL